MNVRAGLLAILLAFFATQASLLADNEGQDKLDEATSLKLDANSVTELGKVIELCEQAMKEGLDESNTNLAKNILAASALQRAQAMLQNLPRVAANPNAVRQLRLKTKEDLDKAIENNPKLADAYLLMARIETLPGGSRENAISNLNKAVELLEDRPVDQAEAYILRAVMQDNQEDQMRDLTKAIEADSTNTNAWQARIELQMRTGKLQEAVDDAEKLLAEDESNMFALEAAIQSLLRLEKEDEAIGLLTSRIEKDPTNGVFYRVRAGAYELNEEPEKALADLDKAIELNDRDALALLARGRMYFDLDEVEKANRDVTDALLIEPQSIQGVIYRSLIAGREGRYGDAISDMELLVRADPSNSAWMMQLASYYQMDDRPRLAIDLLDELIKNRPQEWRAFRLRGDAKLSISAHEEAIEDYEESIRVLEETRELSEDAQATDLDYSGLLNNLAWVLATSPVDEIRDGKRSIELGLKACEATDYEKAHILSTLAAGYAEIGDFENARKWAAKAVELGEKEEDDPEDQLSQLKKELESYKENKPWREEQKTEENTQPLIPAGETIDT